MPSERPAGTSPLRPPRARAGQRRSGQRLARRGLVVLAVGGPREDEAAEPGGLAEAARERRAQQCVGLGQGVGADREMQRQLAQHAGVLRPLPGEEHGELAGRTGAAAVVNAGRKRPRVAAETGQRQVELAGLQVGLILGDDRHRLDVRAPASGEAVGEVAQGHARMAPEVGAKGREPADEPGPVGVAPEQQLGRPALGGRRAPALPELAPYSSSTAWKLVPPKPKALSRHGAAVARLEPGTRLVDAGRAGSPAPRGSGSASRRRGRRQDPVVQGQRRLDQPGDAGRGLGVADHRLDRPDRRLPRRAPSLPKSSVSALQLGACRRRPCRCRAPRPGRRCRREPGHRVGAAQRPHLALGPRRGQAPGMPSLTPPTPLITA